MRRQRTKSAAQIVDRIKSRQKRRLQFTWGMWLYDEVGRFTGKSIYIGSEDRIRRVEDTDGRCCTIHTESGATHTVHWQRVCELNRWIRHTEANPQDYYTLEGASDD